MRLYPFLVLSTLVLMLSFGIGCSKKDGTGDDDDDNNTSTKFDPDPAGPCEIPRVDPVEPVGDGTGWVVMTHCEIGSCAAGNKQNDIWIAALDGSELRMLTTNAAEGAAFVDNRYLDTTPDNRILYKSLAASGATEWELHVVDLDGNDTLLAANASYYGGQTDNGLIVFMRGLGPDQTITPDRDLYSVDLSGNETTLLATPGTDDSLEKILTGDDLVVLAGSGPADGSGANIGDLYYVRADGTGLTQLSVEPGREKFNGITPSGRMVYTNIQSPGPPPADPLADIFSIRLDGSDKVNVATQVDQEIAALVVDEYVIIQYIIMVPTMDPNVKIPQYDLYAINADGTGLVTLANTEENQETLVGVSSWCTAIFNEVHTEQINMQNVTFTRTFSYSLPDAAPPVLLDDLGDEGAFTLFYASNSRKIFYDRAGKDAYVIREDGTERTPLSTSNDAETIIDLALGQKRALYKRSFTTPSPDVYHTVNIDGTDDQPLALELTGNKQYFGRAGSHVILTHQADGEVNVDVISVSAQGGETIMLAAETDTEIPAHLLSDGTVIYTRYRGTFGNDLFVVPADGSVEAMPLVEESGDDRFAAFIR